MENLMIRASFLTLSLLLPLVLLTACDDGQKDAAAQKAAEMSAAPYSATGEMTYLARIALHPDSVAVIKVQNETNGEAVFEKRTELHEQQVPIPFSLEIPRDRLQDGTAYTLHLSIEHDGAPSWASDPVALDFAAQNPALGTIRLMQAEQKPVAESAVTHVLYLCGDKEIRLSLSAAGAELTLDDGVRHALKDVVSASGAKYEAVDQSGLFFWSKGNTALVTQNGQDWPECIAKTADAGTHVPLDADTDTEIKIENPAQITGMTWLLEDLNGGGIIDNSHMTLLLDGQGNASGHSGCNRYSAAYELKDATLAIKPNAAMTMMACAPALMEQEQRFVDALLLMSAYHFDETGALILSGGEKTLKFRVEAKESPAAVQDAPAP
jgi:heat shock protein HslJ/membrane-bound inhibitor of C-type lysozyme